MISGMTEDEMNILFSDAMGAVGDSMCQFAKDDADRLTIIGEAVLHRGIAMKMIEMMEIGKEIHFDHKKNLKCPEELKVKVMKYCDERLNFIYDTTIKYMSTKKELLSGNKMHLREIKKGIGKNSGKPYK